MGTTPLGIVYPESTANTQLWTHFQTMADDVDGLIDTDRDLRDAAFSSYTPSITGSTSGTWTAGNATFNSYYFRLGRLVFVWGEIVCGTTTSITAVTSGSLHFSLPVASKASHSAVVGIANAIDASVPTRIVCTARWESTTKISMMQTSGSFIANNTATWATSDSFGWQIVYEAASAP